MDSPLTFTEPTTRDELLAALASVHAQATTFWQQFTDESFFAAPPRGWSPADNVRHLIQSTQPVTMALRLPRWLPRLLFGRARQPSRGYAEVRDAYLRVLAAGGQAGRFAPKPQPRPRDLGAARAKIMEGWRRAGQDLLTAAHRWDDAGLDGVRLPHPLLGKLTVREMLAFTLFHQTHHVGNVARRLAG